MRLERLTLKPYGGFADRTLTFAPGAPLHVVLGANEAGKTTALNAIADLLYGFPLRTDHGWRFDMTALRVGGALRFADGSVFEARRRKGRGNTLVDAEDKPLADAPLSAALGGVDRQTFEAEFGLTAKALRDGGEALLSARGALAETLAAGSANLSALVKLRDGLGVEADQLFTQRRSAGKAFYVALESYENAEKKLRDAVVTADALKATEQKSADALNAEQKLREDYEEAGRALAMRERASRTHLVLARLSALAHEAESFLDLPLIDAASLIAARQALDGARALDVELARLAAEARTEAEQIDALALDKALLDEGAAIDGLREKLGAVRKASEDLPRRLEARTQAITELDEIARRLGLADPGALLAAPPTAAELAFARQALEDHRNAARRLVEQQDRVRELATRRDQLGAGAAEAAPADPEPLRRRLDVLSERVADVERLRRERAGIDTQARELVEEAARLDPAVEDFDALACAALPDRTEIAVFAEADQQRAKARQVAERELDKAAREVSAAEATLRKREGEAKGATRADWRAARERRDGALEKLQQALDGDAGRRREAFDASLALVSLADVVGERVVDDTERAARLQSAREDIAARRETLTRAQVDSQRLADERAASEGEWRALWARSGVAPRAPAAMALWADRVDALRKRRAELAERRAEAQTLSARLQNAEESLRQWFAALGLAPPPGFDLAYKEARTELEARQSAWEAARKATEARAGAARAAAEADAEAARRQRELAEVSAHWPKAMRGLRLAEDASSIEAEAALAAWGEVELPRQKRDREARSIEGIERDLEDFAAGVSAVVLRVAPDAGELGPEAALARLLERLTAGRKAAAEHAQLTRSAEQRAARRRAEEARRQALAPALSAARARLAVVDDDALALALERCEARRAREDEGLRLAQQLGQIGDGHSEAELRAEQQSLDPDRLADEIAGLRQRRDALDADRREAARAARDAEAGLELLSRGRDAAGAARERMEARGDLLDNAERWVLRQGARLLADRVIERHRAAMQDPLVGRAGALFRIATGETYAGLATDYDSNDRPVLAAARANGDRVKVEALSEGARDQLFLSLRLALIERRAGEPLPFVGDDILASFDDERTKLMLRLLADFGARSQAIVFTHHSHVAELARTAGADVVEL